MIKTAASIETGNLPGDIAETNTGIENHKMAINHLADASAHYSAAGNHHKSGDHDKAHESIIAAQSSLQLASKAQKEELKYHSLKS